VLLGEVIDLDIAGRRVILRDGEAAYDTLIVATGSSHHYFGNDQWEPLAPALKTIEDATEIRRRILLAFEKAEREPTREARSAWLTFVVVGAGRPASNWRVHWERSPTIRSVTTSGISSRPNPAFCCWKEGTGAACLPS